MHGLEKRAPIEKRRWLASAGLFLYAAVLFAGDPVPTGRRRREGPARTAPGHIAGMAGRVRPDIGVAQRMRDRANTPRPVGTATSEALWKTKPPN